jgi:hypothetical protein
MQGIHTYIPERNHVSRVHCVAAILRGLLMVHIALPAILNSSVRLRYQFPKVIIIIIIIVLCLTLIRRRVST